MNACPGWDHTVAKRSVWLICLAQIPWTLLSWICVNAPWGHTGSALVWEHSLSVLCWNRQPPHCPSSLYRISMPYGWSYEGSPHNQLQNLPHRFQNHDHHTLALMNYKNIIIMPQYPEWLATPILEFLRWHSYYNEIRNTISLLIALLPSKLGNNATASTNLDHRCVSQGCQPDAQGCGRYGRVLAVHHHQNAPSSHLDHLSACRNHPRYRVGH